MKAQILKTNLKIAAVLLLLLTTACGCVKDNQQDELPPITQTGENTFGCVVDGEVLIPKDRFTGSGGIISRRIGLKVSIDKYNYFSVRSVNNHDDRSYVYIYI